MIDEEKMTALVPSADVRKFMRDTGYIFTDWQEAALLFHNSIRLEKKFAYLRELMEKTADEKLKGQIAEYLRFEEKKIRCFKENPERDYFYLLTCMDEDSEEKVYFFDFEAAVKYGRDNGGCFSIEKYPIVSDTMDSELFKDFQSGAYGSVGYMSYDASGEAYDVWNTEPAVGEARWGYEKEDHFGFVFYEVPNPFDRGDIVKLKYEGSEEYGIVECTQREWKEDLEAKIQRKRRADYSDVQIRVVFLQDDGTFAHEHINPVDLEYYPAEWSGEYDTKEESARDCLLVMAGELYRGKGSLEDVCWLGEVYRSFHKES